VCFISVIPATQEAEEGNHKPGEREQDPISKTKPMLYEINQAEMARIACSLSYAESRPKKKPKKDE
jgi:hypothetical protein